MNDDKNSRSFVYILFLLNAGLTNLMMTLLLGAYLLNSTNAQPESPLQTSCTTCCQGPAGSQGNPGIPGVPGTNGMPGNLGPKGNRGESIKGDRGESVKGEKGDNIKGDIGSRGEKGEAGSPGLKGESGVNGSNGLPGKIGPPGVAGLVGSPGLPGVKGQKGEMGQSRVSAFSAARRSSFTPSSDYEAIPFEIIHTNVADDFNAASGQFTCEIPGIYMFTYNILSYKSNPRIHLMKNNDKINSVYRSVETFHDMIGNTAVLQLVSGDQVWVQCRYAGKEIYSDSDLHCITFSGVLLHEM